MSHPNPAPSQRSIIATLEALAWPLVIMIALDHFFKNLSGLILEQVWHQQGAMRIPITSFFNLSWVMNQGVSFGLLPMDSFTGSVSLSFFSFAVCLCLARWYHMAPDQGMRWGLCLILGGGLSNAIDRLLYGAVRDMLDFYWEPYHFPTFNFADIFVTFGAIIILLETLRHHRKPQKNMSLKDPHHG